MVIIASIAAAVVIVALGVLFYLANGARVRNGRREFPTPKETQKQRAAGID
jgi:hypothetical protein